MPRRYLSSVLRKDKPCWKPSSIYNSLFVPIPPSSPTLLCAASTRVFALSSVTPLPRIFLSCQIFRIPFTPSAITSFGNGAFSSTARPLIASNLVYNPRYSGKCIASHLWILFADMLLHDPVTAVYQVSYFGINAFWHVWD